MDLFLIVIVMLVIGPMGRFPGVIIGAFMVTILNELLGPTKLFRLVIFGALVVLSVLLVPKGLMGALDSIIKPVKKIVKEQAQKLERKRGKGLAIMSVKHFIFYKVDEIKGNISM